MFSRRPETNILIKLLTEAAGYELLPDEVLNGAIGMPARSGKGYGYLRTAMRTVLMEKNWVFEVVAKQGVRRAKPEEVVDNSATALTRQRRLAQRSTRKLSALSPEEYKSLSAEKQVLHNTRLSMFGVIEVFSMGATEKKIQAKALTAALPPKQMLELFA